VGSLTQKDISLQFKHELFTNGDYSKFARDVDEEENEANGMDADSECKDIS
jgi:hypothetical protein